MTRRIWPSLALTLVASGCSGKASQTAPTQVSLPSSTVRLRGDVWADNWFAFYLGERLVAEDSVPITVERSFNAETFTFDATYPLDLNFVVRDFIQDDTGLEYIGTPNQQMGDGGFIWQLTDTATGRVVAASDGAMRCLVIHKAPLNPSCEKASSPATACQSLVLSEPTAWKAPGFDASSWPFASIFTAAQVGPKDGYTTIRWESRAQLVWSSDLKADNTLLCKRRVEGP